MGIGGERAAGDLNLLLQGSELLFHGFPFDVVVGPSPVVGHPLISVAHCTQSWVSGIIKSLASRILGITRPTLDKKVKEYGIEKG